MVLVGCAGNAAPSSTITQTVTVSASASSSPGGSSSPTSSPSPSLDPQTVLAGYFDAFGTRQIMKMEAMRDFAKPGSPADLYAIHQLAAAEATSGDGGGDAPDKVTISPTEVTMTSTSVLTGDKTTSVYRDFKFDAGGRLVTWSVKGNGPLAPRIKPVKGSVTSDDITVQLQTAYVTNVGDLAVTFKVINKSDSSADVRVTDYLNPGGKQVRPQLTPVVLDPRAGAYMQAYAVMSDSKIGGKLIIDFGDGRERQLVVK